MNTCLRIRGGKASEGQKKRRPYFIPLEPWRNAYQYRGCKLTNPIMYLRISEKQNYFVLPTLLADSIKKKN